MTSFAMLAACSSPERPLVALPPTVPAAAPAPRAMAETRNAPLKHLANRVLKPMPVRPLNASTNCFFRDETGYQGRLDLDVAEATVKRFDARVNIPKRGSCRFRLRDFDQVDSLPAVVLAARKSDCTVRLWEQGAQVTVAFRDCRSECSGTSSDYLWPILVDNRKGSCS